MELRKVDLLLTLFFRQSTTCFKAENLYKIDHPLLSEKAYVETH